MSGDDEELEGMKDIFWVIFVLMVLGIAAIAILEWVNLV